MVNLKRHKQSPVTRQALCWATYVFRARGGGVSWYRSQRPADDRANPPSSPSPSSFPSSFPMPVLPCPCFSLAGWPGSLPYSEHPPVSW